jgi:hypothetical protein
MLESSVKKACLGWLKTLPHSHFWSNPASKFGNAGRPDIEGCINGKFIAVECKTPETIQKKEQGRTPAQSDFMRRIEEAEGVYITTASLLALKLELTGYFEELLEGKS